MSKGRILEDTFEQLAELGQSTVKKTAKSAVQIVDPFYSGVESGSDKLKNMKDNHTPLDFERLKNKFQDKDKTKTEALRNRLFHMVKQGDERLLMEERQKELEKRRREELEKQEKKRQEEERIRKETGSIPMGKIRRSIFSPKKAAQQQHTEVRPASGKQ